MDRAVKFGFVILQYMQTDMTIKCINNIENTFYCAEGEYRIVIVDNASPNQSGLKLKQRYINDNRIDVLINSSNEGFARGNNVGYNFIRDKYNPQFIIVMNNDIIIKQIDFFEKTCAIHENTQFDILGPDIVRISDGVHQSPMYRKMPSYETIKSWYEDSVFRCTHPIASFLKLKIKDILLRRLKKNNKDEELKKNYNESMTDVVLQGACYIFGPNFIKNRKYCFNPSTFFYGEEFILYQECHQQGLRMIYDPEIRVQHLDGGTTKKCFQSEFEKYKFMNRNLKETYNLLLGLWKE